MMMELILEPTEEARWTMQEVRCMGGHPLNMLI